MDIESIIQQLIVYARENVIVAVIIGITIIYLLFRHPKVLLLIALFFVTAYGMAQIFDKLSKAGLG